MMQVAVLCLFAIAAVNKVRSLNLGGYVPMLPMSSLPPPTELPEDDTPPMNATSHNHNTNKHWKLGVGLGVPLVGVLSYLLIKRRRVHQYRRIV